MLERLDDVDWSSLSHAYGAAVDVPGMIRSLAAVDPEVRSAAFHAAYGNIYHQGTRYSATPKAIPFLIELAAQPQPKQLDQLLHLITYCVAGYLTPVGGPSTATGPIWGEPPRSLSDYGETLEIVQACEAAAEPAVPLCLRLLTDPEPGVRAAACHLLAALQAYAQRYEVVPRIRERLAIEEDQSVRAMLVFVLTHVLPVTENAQLQALVRDDRDALVRMLAAMGCTRRGIATAEIATLLIDGLSDDELAIEYATLPFSSEDLAGDLGSLLALLSPEVLRTAMPRLLERLRTAQDFGVVGILDAALTATFGTEPPPATLTAEQREVLETLAHNQAFWSIGNALSLLMDRELPSMRDEMAEYLGITVEHDPVEAGRVGARAMPFGSEAAVEHWRQVLAIAPDDLEALESIGPHLIELDEHAEAEQLLQRAIELGSKDGRTWFSLGLCRYQAGEIEGALAAFEQAYDLLTGDERIQAGQNRVAMLQRLGRAEEALDLRLEREPQTATDFFHLGLAQVKAGRHAECIASITRVLAEDPNHANAHYTIACAYALSGDPDNALASIARALEINPELAPDIEVDADFASLVDDPRFIELVGLGEQN